MGSYTNFTIADVLAGLPGRGSPKKAQFGHKQFQKRPNYKMGKRQNKDQIIKEYLPK